MTNKPQIQSRDTKPGNRAETWSYRGMCRIAIPAMVCSRGASLTHRFNEMKNKVLLAFGLVLTFLVTGCDSMKDSSNTQSQTKYYPVYEGDSPESARWKGLGVCMAAAVSDDSFYSLRASECKEAFDRQRNHNE